MRSEMGPAPRVGHGLQSLGGHLLDLPVVVVAAAHLGSQDGVGPAYRIGDRARSGGAGGAGTLAPGVVQRHKVFQGGIG